MHTCKYKSEPKVLESIVFPYYLQYSLFSVLLEKILVISHYINLISGPTLNEKQDSNLQHVVWSLSSRLN